MEFRQSGQSNQRRRRVLKDDTTAATTEDGSAEGNTRRGRTATNHRRYSDHALAEHQLRVTDLIPQRPWTYLVLVLSGLLVITTIQTLYLHHSLGERLVGRNNLAALDPTRSGSIAGWVSSMLLGLSAIAGLLVFSLRRHKIDDYRGRYRIWLPLVGIFLAASLDSTTGLHRAGRGLVELLARNYGAGTALGASPYGWWVGLCLFFSMVVGIRLGIEMRQSRAAMVKLVLAQSCYVGLALFEWKVMVPDFIELQIVASSAARLLGDLCLCLATTSYARYVYLDAQGILAARRLAREQKRQQAAAEKQARREAAAARKQELAEAKKSAAGSKSEDEAVEQKSPQEKPAPVAASAARGEAAAPPSSAKPGPLAGRGALAAASDEPDDDDDPDGDEEHSHLSRAERRRLKKLQRRETRKAA